MSNQDGFKIEILSQGWLGDEETQYDICSHGTIHLVIGSEVISSPKMDYGISVGALAMLRTLEKSFSSDDFLHWRIIPHGCSPVLEMNCPIGIHWSVSHQDQFVLISDVIKYDETNEKSAITYTDLDVKIPKEDYRQCVVSFALEAKKYLMWNQDHFMMIMIDNSMRYFGQNTRIC